MMLHKLFTGEDKFMTHKFLGLLSIFNFVSAINNFCFSQNHTLFPNTSNTYFLYILVTHSLLHLSSFQFLISDKRNKKYNIIWPEMRIHSMLFAYRSIITMYVLYLINPTYTNIVRYAIVILTMILADLTTIKYNNTGISRTMRDNPYPENTHPLVIKYVNGFYSVSQVFATLHILFAPNIEYVYLTLIPIQIAPFLMTLQRKGFMNQASWHIYYVISILINYLYSAVHLYNPIKSYVFVILFVYFRFYKNVNKYLVWTIIYLCYNNW